MTSIAKEIRRRAKANRDVIAVYSASASVSKNRALSPLLAATTEAVGELVTAHVRGRTLDAGCGHQPFRSTIESVADSYTGLDIEARVDGVDVLADLEDLSGLASASFDSVVCSEVLEHVPHPNRALAELARVLAPGGVLVLSVPFLSRLHEEPHDYFRYTKHGLRVMLEEAGFSVEEIHPTGSIFSFLGHQISTALLTLTWHWVWARPVVMGLNQALVVTPARWADRLPGLAELYPLGYVVVARR